jgi:DNA-binding response OmpR family regulator
MDEQLPDKPITAAAPKHKKVLCIEDEHFISELYTRALKKAGYEVTVSADGAEGLSKAKTGEFDIVLLDIMLPNLIGTDVLKQLKDPALGLKSKVVITTNLEQKEDARQAIEKQADGYIVKAEVTPKQLVAFLQHFES